MLIKMMKKTLKDKFLKRLNKKKLWILHKNMTLKN